MALRHGHRRFLRLHHTGFSEGRDDGNGQGLFPDLRILRPHRHPLFVLMGQIAFNAGIAKRLYDGAHRFMGHIPGGLALATVAGVTIFKAICGSSAATTATFAGVAVPEMDRFGYDKKLSTGIVAVAGTLGILLPPSVVLIIFGMITEQSIGKLFLAGFFPGLLLAALFARSSSVGAG